MCMISATEAIDSQILRDHFEDQATFDAAHAE